MSEKSALVDGVRRIAQTRRKSKGGKAKGEAPDLLVHFASGAVGRLDPASPRDRVWQEVLESLQESKQLAYVELDPETSRVTTLLLPQSFGVLSAEEASDGRGLDLHFEISHAVHRLDREHPRFEELKRLLLEAQRSKFRLLVTESLEEPTIVDVRPEPEPGRSKQR